MQIGLKATNNKGKSLLCYFMINININNRNQCNINSLFYLIYSSTTHLSVLQSLTTINVYYVNVSFFISASGPSIVKTQPNGHVHISEWHCCYS